MTTNCEVITKWHDVFLMWNPDDYDNIRDTRHDVTNGPSYVI